MLVFNQEKLDKKEMLDFATGDISYFVDVHECLKNNAIEEMVEKESI